VKLVRREPETGALAAYLRDWPTQASSALLLTEVVLAVWRAEMGADGPAVAIDRARQLLDDIDLIDIDRSILERAARIEPPIRALDAVHLASAEALGDSLGALVTYDARMTDTARVMGMRVVAPSP